LFVILIIISSQWRFLKYDVFITAQSLSTLLLLFLSEELLVNGRLVQLFVDLVRHRLNIDILEEP
jgi:hypothetical protein